MIPEIDQYKKQLRIAIGLYDEHECCADGAKYFQCTTVT